MTRLIRDGYFWLIVVLAVSLGVLIYVPSISTQHWLPPYEEWELTYLAIQRPLFLVVVAFAAWRFGTRGGLSTYLTVTLMAAPHAVIDLARANWQPQLILDLAAIGAVGLVFIWLIGRQEKGERLLQEAADRLEKSRDYLKVQVQLRTAEWSWANEQLEQDVIKRKKAEEKLQELYEREQKLRRELEEQIRRRVEFTRALVHELKTPLTIVQAASDLLLEEITEEPKRSLAQKIDRGTAKLSKRIDELLDLAKGEIGMLKLKPESVEPLRLLHNLVDDLAPAAAKQGKTLELDLPDFLPSVQADQARLQEVLLNLSNNALKFTPTGGKIIFKSKVVDSNLVFEVEDTGRGIPKLEQRRIFQPYYQREDNGDNLGGLGLGLSLSKMLIELHGGQIWVKSERGKGSTFGFSLPLRNTISNKIGV